MEIALESHSKTHYNPLQTATIKTVAYISQRNAQPALRALSFVPVIGKEVYITPTLQGSRGGRMAAQAWATLQFFGEE